MALGGSKTWVPLAIAGGGATGALAALWMVRREIRKSAQCPPEAAPEPEARAPIEKAEEVSPEIVAIISAAVSAFLGKTARVRGIRPARAAAASPWSQQGRVSIQGSHMLARQ